MEAQVDRLPKPGSIESYVCGGLRVLGCVAGMLAWFQSGHVAGLLGALAFAAVTPAWYWRPVSFTRPLKEQLRARREPMPKPVMWLLLIGFFPLAASVVARFVA